LNIIVPMAGMGKRLRPHTLTTAKPLIHVAGKPIVEHLVEDIVAVCKTKVNEIAFVTGRFGEEVEQRLIAVAEQLGAKGSIHYQDEALGTAHAILCAAELLSGPVTVAFADTLFSADFTLDMNVDGVLWVQRIEDPRQFGVVVLDSGGVISEFKEKPQEFVSDLAMIGIYYFKQGEVLRSELQYLIDHDIRNGGEYQLPDALRNMVKKGARFVPGTVNDWMDCGNKQALVETNSRYLGHKFPAGSTGKNLKQERSIVIPPCYIADDVSLINCIVGPGVSIGSGVHIESSVISNSILRENAVVKNSVLNNAVIGKNARSVKMTDGYNLGDFSCIDG
jgi:glucose-1-phosphate thymidylyltransferase